MSLDDTKARHVCADADSLRQALETVERNISTLVNGMPADYHRAEWLGTWNVCRRALGLPELDA